MSSDRSFGSGFVTAWHLLLSWHNGALPFSVLVTGKRQRVEKSFVIACLSWLTTEWPGVHDDQSMAAINNLLYSVAATDLCDLILWSVWKQL